MWLDIAGIVFVCVTMNHLGLIGKLEEIMGELPILDCPKCCSCWCVCAYTLFVSHEVITSLAISFLASYMALWLELFEGYIDTLYMKLYGKIYNTSDDTASADTNDGNSESAVPKLQQTEVIN